MKIGQKFRPLRHTLAITIAGALAVSTPCMADEPLVLSFVDGGAFFSQQAGLERAVDPQVFVYDANATLGTGPQGIEHIAHLRNARLDDEPLLPLYNAQGKSLALTARNWLSARGTLEVETQPDGRDLLIANFKHLAPFGVYSLFLETFEPNGKTIARPFDGDGSESTFSAHADGSILVAVESPHLTHDNAVALVYHSDGQEHGVSRGLLGVTAHERLLVRMP